MQRLKYGGRFEEVQQLLDSGQNGSLEEMQSLHDAVEAMVHDTQGQLS